MVCNCPEQLQKCLVDTYQYNSKVQSISILDIPAEEKRFTLYRYCSKALNYTYRKKLPECIIANIKDKFPSETYVGYRN